MAGLRPPQTSQVFISKSPNLKQCSLLQVESVPQLQSVDISLVFAADTETEILTLVQCKVFRFRAHISQ